MSGISKVAERSEQGMFKRSMYASGCVCRGEAGGWMGEWGEDDFGSGEGSLIGLRGGRHLVKVRTIVLVFLRFPLVRSPASFATAGHPYCMFLHQNSLH